MQVLATHEQGGVSALLILGLILLLIIAALVAIGIAQRNDPDRAARMQFRDALYSSPRRRSTTAVTPAQNGEPETVVTEGENGTSLAADEQEATARDQDEGEAKP
ncbi:hypothetical protein SK854_13695 [Lentzea sp. BCCO 10_0061]|uniref:Secreted protein n=1 Tax=Lentzea sokolovensis TaxID=3095429 RepID=A0ABU4UV82_9PSEU|nr:hypothetical protein [Lentzea sp. BCCO 10_0061]MDX8143175.1 hypothetical protein [Lentzea sp. BCCO 10_0061]